MKKKIQIPQHFLGEYNAYNAYAAYLATSLLGITDDKIEKAMQTFTFPKGRGEIVHDNNFSVMIDFAHTPHSFEVLLPTLKKQIKGKLIHVFGTAGKRDVSKRPLMGKVASQYDDVMILTSEDPRNEEPEKIMDDVLRDVKQKKSLEIYRIPDRKEAIEKAISVAKKGDFIVVTGKAHETSMNYGHGEIPWNEFSVVTKALQKYAK